MKLAIIPARGGSKRIFRKNIRDFCGKPILAYSIETALASSLFDHVIVSTDDDEIASIANHFGAETPFLRPPELSDDFTGTNAVVKNAIEWYQRQGKSVSLVCCIYATAPFLKIKYLKEGYEKLVDSNMWFAFSVTTFPYPIQRAIYIHKEGGIDLFWPDFANTRSQDLEEAYHDAGQFYWGRSEAFINDKSLFSKKSVPVIIPRYLVQDIDTMEDWQRAELMFKAMQRAR